jgi:hypothetical protein
MQNYLLYYKNYWGTWNPRDIFNCYLERLRKVNATYYETVRDNITSLEMCNRFFDSNYLIIKIKQIQKEVEIEIKRIDSEVEAKLKQLVKDKEVVIRLALSFGWLAIIMICFFFHYFSFEWFI